MAKVYQANEIKNIALMGGSGSGKTTMMESMLLESGIIKRRGTVEAQSTVCDYFPVEKEYGYSVFSTVCNIEFGGKKLNIIDCAGSDDFCGGTVTALHVVDTAAIMLTANGGVEVGTQNNFRLAENAKKPVVFVVNKCDHENADFERTFNQLKDVFGNKCTLIQFPVNAGAGFNAGDNTRQRMPQRIVDFPGQKLFTKATVETCILLLSADSNQHQMQACSTIKRAKGLYTYVHEHFTPCDFSGSEDWVIRSEMDRKILKKVQTKGSTLAVWGMDIHFGLKTGRNDIFIVNDDKRQEILANCQTEEERERTVVLFKPLVKGEDLRRYKMNFADRWLIHTHNGIKDQETKEIIIPRIDINDYPALKAYLDANSNKISNRTDQGDTFYNLRNCVYWPEFEKPKLIWGDLADIPKFYLDESGYYGDNTTYCMGGEHLTYLLVYLNSPLSAYLFSKLGNTTGAGTIRWQKFKVEQQLVPNISPDDEQRILDHYRQYQQTNDEAHLEGAYHIIYNVVGLTEEEVEYIEKNVS